MREPQQVPRNLQAPVRELERLAAAGATAVLRRDERLEHIEVRRLDAASQPVAHLPRKPPHLGNDPLQQVPRKDHRSWLRRRRRGHESFTRHLTCTMEKPEVAAEKEEEEEEKREDGRWEKGTQGVLAARSPKK